MPDQEHEALITEAADIFVRLREDPQDPDSIARRDAFRQRGARERDIYARVARAWESAGTRPGPGKPLAIAVALIVAASVFFVAAPLRRDMMADFRTGLEPNRVALASGDAATLDAQTALVDDTTDRQRRFEMLGGAAVFEVAKETRPFVVGAGALDVEVLGTVFEVARRDDQVSVSVIEGVVQVSGGDGHWTLEAGDSLSWSRAEGASITALEPQGIAPWRQNRLVADGMTFADVAEVIDRRLRGRIVIASGALAQSRVSGTIDLERPEQALQALAATRGARILQAPGLGHLILP